LGNQRKRENFEDLGVEGRTILKTDLQEIVWEHGLHLSDSG
jgi:hypothetical protein